MLNTIGPVWDGNEVWLITAGAATFAAFPFWYASLFSTLYMPLVLVLLGLIFRAVAIEYRGKGATERWARVLGLAHSASARSSSAFGVGAALALTTTGLPIDANGDRVGGPFAWLTPYAVLGGLAVVGFCLVHAATFLALKTDGAGARARGPLRRALGAGRAAADRRLGAASSSSRTASVVHAGRSSCSPWSRSSRPGWRRDAGREGRAFIGIAAFLAARAPRRSSRPSTRSCCRRPSTAPST